MSGKRGVCVVALSLCCVAPVAAQSVSGDVSPEVSTAQTDSAVSAEVDPQIDAGYAGMATASGGRSRGGDTWAPSGSVWSGHGASAGARAVVMRTMSPAAARLSVMQYGKQNMRSTVTPHRFRSAVSEYGLHSPAFGAACSGTGGVAGDLLLQSCGGRMVRVTGAASYSKGFADSTRGTALVSPPDAGTSSPLEWTPSGVGSGELSFMPKSFLNPSLHVGMGIPGRPSGRRRKRAGSRLQQPGLGLPSLQSPLLQANPLEQSPLAPGLTNSAPGLAAPNLLPSPLGTNNGLSGSLSQQ